MFLNHSKHIWITIVIKRVLKVLNPCQLARWLIFMREITLICTTIFISWVRLKDVHVHSIIFSRVILLHHLVIDVAWFLFVWNGCLLFVGDSLSWSFFGYCFYLLFFTMIRRVPGFFQLQMWILRSFIEKVNLLHFLNLHHRVLIVRSGVICTDWDCFISFILILTCHQTLIFSSLLCNLLSVCVKHSTRLLLLFIIWLLLCESVLIWSESLGRLQLNFLTRFQSHILVWYLSSLIFIFFLIALTWNWIALVLKCKLISPILVLFRRMWNIIRYTHSYFSTTLKYLNYFSLLLCSLPFIWRDMRLFRKW